MFFAQSLADTPAYLVCPLWPARVSTVKYDVTYDGVIYAFFAHFLRCCVRQLCKLQSTETERAAARQRYCHRKVFWNHEPGRHCDVFL
jgi:hypothetical protein